MKTQTIAGNEVTLEEGTRYIASRPLAERGNIDRQRFTVSIRELSGLNSCHSVSIPDLTYDQANEFLLEFNNSGMTSLEGRIW